MNRLATERSPYLLQHAANPVDWYAWGDEAFARAREENKPIFLSVGYSTCHWCHVMERESFENDAVALVLNQHFVSIKVDREERPDVDRVYMMFVQATTGSGGWPMSVWLTPDLRPFYGGTYFPPSSRWGRPGFTEILHEIARVWRDERGQVEQSAGSLVERLRTLERAKPVWTVPEASVLSRTVRQFRGAFDGRFGGFGEAPKFPRPSELLFLMREHARTGDADARGMALQTLKAMALGGMRDHVGGGFHRYSVDGQWRVPHFEKMLYDQAQLVLAYVEASQLAADVSYAEIAEDTARYVLREMTDSLGGFYSAEDADSLPPESSLESSSAAQTAGHTAGQVAHPAAHGAAHKMEGAFYLWRAAEIDSLLGDDDARVVKLRFGIEANGNAPHDPQQEFTGKNLLYIARSVDDIARETGKSPSEAIDILNRARVRLFEERLNRPRPDRDEKILSAWNGLMIAALARVDRVLRGHHHSRVNEPRKVPSIYLDAARRAATFIREQMWNPTTRILARRSRDGHAEIDGFAEDYAFVAFGLLELFQADPDPVWLEWAVTLQRRMDELFWDEDEGGWFSTTGKDPSVLLRLKDEYDGAEPTASSVAVLNLLTLTHLVHEPVWVDRIERTLRLFGSRLDRMGRAVPLMGAALSSYVAGSQQIVVVEGPAGDGESVSGNSEGFSGNNEGLGAAAADALERVAAGRYLPFAITLRVSVTNRHALEAMLPAVAAMQPVGGISAAYVCRDFVCRQPVTTTSELEASLRESRGREPTADLTKGASEAGVTE